MNKTLSTILIVIAVLALAGGIFFAGSMYARTYGFGPALTLAPRSGRETRPGPSAGVFGYGWNNNNSYGPRAITGTGGYGMMGGQRGYGMTLAPRSGRETRPAGARRPGASAGVSGYGWNNGTNSNATPLTIDQARQAAQKYVQSLNIQELEISEVMVFNNNAYVAVKETSTGLGAFELLVDPVSQVAYPEYGPNMMWNLEYGGLSHGSMMGGWNYRSTIPANVSADMPVTKDQAIKNAQAYLDQVEPGSVAANDPTQFYGYYTLDFSKDGKIVGMLSVNGYNGQIFLHTWHGTFIEESE